MSCNISPARCIQFKGWEFPSDSQPANRINGEVSSMGFISPAKVCSRAVAAAWTVAFVAILLATASCQSQVEPEGLPNFGQVTKTLYRGAQPSREGFRALQRMGVTIVVNFRDDQESNREKH